jgi:hypothetical protein
MYGWAPYRLHIAATPTHQLPEKLPLYFCAAHKLTLTMLQRSIIVQCNTDMQEHNHGKQS